MTLKCCHIQLEVRQRAVTACVPRRIVLPGYIAWSFVAVPSALHGGEDRGLELTLQL